MLSSSDPVITSAKDISTFRSNLIAVLLLALMALLAGGAVRRESITIDEIAHTGAGVSYLQQHDMRMNLEHPPLSKVIAAVPLVLRRSHADYSHISWTFSGSGFNQYLGEWVFGHWFLMKWNDPRSTIFLARLAMLLVALLLGYIIYRGAARLGGNWAGLLCLTAYVTTPAFLAFGPLVITDIVFTLFWVLTIWQLTNLWRSPGPAQILKFSVPFAAALLSKFSSGLLFFVFLGVVISLRLSPIPEQPSDKLALRKWRRRALLNIAKGTACAALLVYLVYFILSWNQPTDSFNVIPGFPASLVLRRLLFPPWLYLQGLIGFAASALTRPTYLLGHSYPSGVWFYFPVIFTLKSQLSFLLLLLLTAFTVVIRRTNKVQRTSVIPEGLKLHWRCLWVSFIVYFLACIFSRLDISIRHFTVAIALIILLLAPLPRMLQQLRSVHPRFAFGGELAAAALSLISLVSAVRAYPYFMPYINSLGMGRPGYMLVNDSNLDWDQSFPDAEAFAQQHGLNQVLLDHYGFSETEAYVPQARTWNCQAPSPADAGQWAIVSANNLADAKNCLWLTRYSHQPLAGGSMYAFALPAVIPQPGQPGGPPLRKDFRYLGVTDMDFDVRDLFRGVIRDPSQLEPTLKHMMELGQQQQDRKRKSSGR